MNTNISALIKIAERKTKKEMLDFADSIIDRGKIYKRSVEGIDPTVTPAILSLLSGQSAADDMAALNYNNALGDYLVSRGKLLRDTVSNYRRVTPFREGHKSEIEKQIADAANEIDAKSKEVADVQDLKAGVGRNIVRGGLGITADALLNDHNGDYGAADTLTSGIGGIGGGLLGSYLAKKTGLKFMGSTLANLGGSALGGWGANKLRRHFS